MGGGEEHNGMVTKAISACSCFIRAEGNWKARSSAIPWGEDPEMRRRKALSRGKIHSREKGGGGGEGIRLSYVEIGNRIFRISIGNSAHFVLCWWKFLKKQFCRSPLLAEFRGGRGFGRSKGEGSSKIRESDWIFGDSKCKRTKAN